MIWIMVESLIGGKSGLQKMKQIKGKVQWIIGPCDDPWLDLKGKSSILENNEMDDLLWVWFWSPFLILLDLGGWGKIILYLIFLFLLVSYTQTHLVGLEPMTSLYT